MQISLVGTFVGTLEVDLRYNLHLLDAAMLASFCSLTFIGNGILIWKKQS
jgi:hypothetical protein